MKDLESIRKMIAQFEDGTYPKEQWSHEAHLIMALWYCVHQPIPEALQSIRAGIKRYNLSVGGKNDEDSGYHETITLFYTKLVIKFISEREAELTASCLFEKLLQQPFLSKNYPLEFYSREVLMSREARKKWVNPNLRALEFMEIA